MLGIQKNTVVQRYVLRHLRATVCYLCTRNYKVNIDWRKVWNTRVGATALSLLLIVSVVVSALISPSPAAFAASTTWDFSQSSSYQNASGKVSLANGSATLSNPGSTLGASTLLNPKAGVSSNGAASFSAANKEYLNIASNSSLQTTGSMEVGLWYKPSGLANQDLIGKWGVGGMEFDVILVSNKVQVYMTGYTNVEATAFGNLSVGNWYFIRSWYDSVADTLNISVNNTATASVSNSAGITAGTSNFRISGINDTHYVDGCIDSAYYKKSISTADEATALYNSGNGRTSQDLTSANGLDAFRTNLVSWWDLNEESGIRYDAVGTNHLNAAAGQIIAPPVYGTALIQPPIYGSEILTNTTFDSNTTGWSAANATLTSIAGGNSNNALEIKETGGTYNGRADVSFTTVIGNSYRFNYWHKNGTAYGAIRIGTSAGGVQIASVLAMNDANWTLRNYEFVATATTTWISLVTDTITTDGSSLFDDVSLKQIATSATGNGGFETAGAGGADVFGSWNETIPAGSAITDETTAINSGAHAAKLTNTTASSIMGQNVTVVAGSSYYYSFWTRGDGAVAGRYYVSDQTHGGAAIVATTTTGVAGTTYTVVSGTFTAPAGCTSVQFGFYSPSAAGSSYFDDVSIKPVTTAAINNGGFDTLGVGGADVFGSWTESVAGTSTVNDESAAPYSGAHALRLDTDASGSYTAVYIGSLISIGRKYKISFYAKTNTDGNRVEISDNTSSVFTATLTTSYAQYTGYFTATDVRLVIKRYTGANQNLYIDSVTLESLGPASDAGIAAGSATDGKFAAQFTGSNFLSRADNASLKTGDLSFELGGWFYLDNLNGKDLVSKWNSTGNQREYSLCLYGSGKFGFAVSPDGATTNIIAVTANTFGVVRASGWYFVRTWHDSVNNILGIQVNNTVADTISYSSGVYASTGPFELGQGRYQGTYQGREDSVYFMKRILTTDEATQIYNNGKGLKYSQLPDSVKANATIISGSTLNGNFETAGTGGQPFANWTKYESGSSTVNIETNDVHSGNRALRLDVDSSINSVSVAQDVLTVGKRYKVTGYAKINDATGSPSLQTSAGGSNQNLLTLTTNYQQFTGYFTASIATFNLKRGSNSNGKSIYIDDVTVEEVPLISYWDLDEKSGIRYDAITTMANDLSDNGTVTQGHGVNYNEGTVSKVLDLSSNDNHFTQTNLSKRPTLASTIVNGKPTLKFDGADDTLVTSGDKIGTGDVTLFTVIKPLSLGGGSAGRLVDNNEFALSMDTGNSRLYTTSNYGSTAFSATSSISLNTSYIIAFTRKSDGKVSFYINGALSGTADQSSGTPVAGSDTYIGNRAAGDRAFDGYIGTTMIFSSILDASSRNQIEKTLGAQYGITVATDNSVASAPTSIYPSFASNTAVRYSTLQSFTETLAEDSSGATRYQLSNDATAGTNDSANWYYWNGAAWVAADPNNAYQSNTAAEVQTNLQAFASVLPAHNLKWKSFLITDGVDNPHISSVNLEYVSDTEPPDAPVLTASLDSAGGSTTLVTGNWYPYATPSFTWGATTDRAKDYEFPIGTAGYLVYFGTDNTANITLTNDLVNPGENNGAFVWQDGTTFTSSQALVTGSTYYLKVIPVDAAGNARYAATSSDYNAFTYKYDGLAPESPQYISVSPSGYSKTNHFTFTWPVVGEGSATDAGGSSLKGYQYRVGPTGDWQDLAGGTSTSSVTLDDAAYQTGLNIFYLRAVDNAGNSDQSPVQANFYFNSSAPKAPQNLTVTPEVSTENAFAFSWDAPAGEIQGYYYSVNALPTTSNANFTTQNYLTAGPYATQQGENTLYLVAKDNAGNYNLSSCATITGNTAVDGCAKVVFSANTVAPGMPGGITAYDISDRNAKSYAAAVKWNEPASKGAGFAGYDIYRSDDGTSFAKVGSTTGTIYADGGLQSKKYYYYAVSKDNAGQVSAIPAAVSVTPTGRYTTPPNLVSGPTAEVAPTSITVRWVTDRVASSYVQIKDGNTFVSEQGQTESATDHEVKVVGLRSQKEYVYTVKSTDIDGNTMESEPQTFTTANTPSVYDLTVSNITQSSAIINFKSSAIANFTLHYGETSNFGQTLTESSGASTTNHSLALSGLDAGKKYYFRLVGLDADGNELRSDNSFDTLPMPAVEKFAIEPVDGAPSTTLKITWKTNVPTTSTVKYAVDKVTFKEYSTSELTEDHIITLPDMADSSTYTLYASGRDQFGNVAESAKTNFTTPNDTRAPLISNLQIESSNVGNSGTKAQIAISWKTDELTDSQVEYDTGLSGKAYTRKTALDSTRTNRHLVIISDLDPGKPYHLRVLSADASGNVAQSGDNTVITGEVSRSALQVILTTLQGVFGWMGKLIK